MSDPHEPISPNGLDRQLRCALDPEPGSVERVVRAALAEESSPLREPSGARWRWAWAAAALLALLLPAALFLRPADPESAPRAEGTIPLVDEVPVNSVLTITNAGGPVRIIAPDRAATLVVLGSASAAPVAGRQHSLPQF